MFNVVPCKDPWICRLMISEEEDYYCFVWSVDKFYTGGAVLDQYLEQQFKFSHLSSSIFRSWDQNIAINWSRLLFSRETVYITHRWVNQFYSFNNFRFFYWKLVEVCAPNMSFLPCGLGVRSRLGKSYIYPPKQSRTFAINKWLE